MQKKSSEIKQGDASARGDIRLNKYLSDHGICSRREADRLILEGKVLVDGRPGIMGERISSQSHVVVNGKYVEEQQEKILLMVNKPVGVECTCDRSNPDNIIDFLNYPKRLIYVGRLDKNSCGLLLMTNDGDLAHHITKSQELHEKEYLVTINRKIDEDFVRKMSSGVEILGRTTRPCKVEAVSDKSFRIILTQGWNRQIRRMCEACGARVIALKRIRIMNLHLNHLKEGSYRKVSQEEYRELMKMCNDNRK